MKLLLILLLSMSIAVSFAGRKSELVMGYKIIKDTTDASVDPTKCKIVGKVFYEDELVPKALVYSQNTRGIRTNEKGEFEITIDTIDQYVTFNMGDDRMGYIEGYKFKAGHLIVCEVYIRDWTMMDVVDKPVVYMYNEGEPIEAKVSLRTEMNLSFTYPLISEEGDWNVTVDSEGISEQGKNYPYLFWEAETEDLHYLQVETAVIGEVVKTDTLVSFLEHKLASIGLNSREQTDYITYWGPRMMSYDYVLTQFNIDEYIDELASLDIQPIPDAKRRLFMLYTGFNYEPSFDVVPPVSKEEGFKRGNFTVLEWGGSEISKEQLYKTL